MSQPSTFATLLRRSKFASYDPAISQLYTAPSAHVHRGDFGFKRPLPRMARTRAPAVVVSCIDTPEYQTAWTDAESQAKFVRRLDESGAHFDLGSEGNWGSKSRHADWMTDSEFDRSSTLSPKPQQQLADKAKGAASRSFASIPAINAMSPAKFRRYVEKTRELRPEFYAYLEEQRLRRNASEEYRLAGYSKSYMQKYGSSPAPPDTPNSFTSDGGQSDIETEPTSLYSAAQIPPLAASKESKKISKRSRAIGAHRAFLAERASTRALAAESALPELTPFPHKHAGLSYHHPSRLQSVLTAPPIPGFVLPAANYNGGFMAQPPPEAQRELARASGNAGRTAGGARTGFLQPSQQSYVAHLAGSYTAGIARSDVFDEPTGSIAKDQRIPPFEFFPTQPKRSPLAANERDTFRLDKAELQSPPAVVHDATTTSLSALATLNAPSISTSQRLDIPALRNVIKAQATPWSSVTHIIRNPHPFGSQAYVAHEEQSVKVDLKQSPIRSVKGYATSNKSINRRTGRFGRQAGAAVEPAVEGEGVVGAVKLVNTLNSLLAAGGGQGAKRR